MKLRLPNKCLSGLALSAMCLSITNAYADPFFLAPIPLFTSYNLNAGGSYSIQGNIQTPTGTTTGAVMVVDPPDPANGRPTGRVSYVFPPIGTFITDETGSYHFNLRGTPPGFCLKNANFKYSTYVTNYAAIKSLPGSNDSSATYAGYTRDSFSCDQNINFTFVDKKIYKTPWDSVRVTSNLYVALPTPVNVPLPGGGTVAICAQAQAYFVGDINTVDFDRSHFEQYFVKPSGCDAAPDYCSGAYPQFNVCEDVIRNQ